MAGDAIPYFRPGVDVPCSAKGAVSGRTFVAFDSWPDPGPAFPGASPDNNINVKTAVAATRAFGVAGWDAADKAKLTVIREGIVPVIAGAAIAAGAEVEVGANGRAVTLAAGRPAGIALRAAGANGDVIAVALALS